MRSLATGLIGLSLLMLSACGEKKVVTPTAPVSGKLTFDGKPLERGQIVFFQEHGDSAQADIGPDGRYSLKAPVGTNRIMVRSHAANCGCTYCADAADAAKVTQAAAEGKDAAKLKKALAQGRGSGMVIPTYFLPERFENHMTSGLQFEVKAGAENTADFDMKK